MGASDTALRLLGTNLTAALRRHGDYSLKWISAAKCAPIAFVDPGAFLVTYVVKLPTRRLLDNLAEPRTRRTSPKLLACCQTAWHRAFG